MSFAVWRRRTLREAARGDRVVVGPDWAIREIDREVRAVWTLTDEYGLDYLTIARLTHLR